MKRQIVLHFAYTLQFYLEMLNQLFLKGNTSAKKLKIVGFITLVVVTCMYGKHKNDFEKNFQFLPQHFVGKKVRSRGWCQRQIKSV